MNLILHRIKRKFLSFLYSISFFKLELKNEVFIFVHNEDLIKKCYDNTFFKRLNPHYVFLGMGVIDRLSEDVIISRLLKYNIEQYKFFTAFTGWYSLWKNKKIKTRYITLLEYDVTIDENFNEELNKRMKLDNEIISFLPLSTRDENFIENELWVKDIFNAIKLVYNIDIKSYIHTLSRANKHLFWSSTSNTAFRYDIFVDYMLWFEPLIPFLIESKYSGHAFERSISFYALLYNKQICFVDNVLVHHNLDSHLTQGNNLSC